LLTEKRRDSVSLAERVKDDRCFEEMLGEAFEGLDKVITRTLPAPVAHVRVGTPVRDAFISVSFSRPVSINFIVTSSFWNEVSVDLKKIPEEVTRARIEIRGWEVKRVRIVSEGEWNGLELPRVFGLAHLLSPQFIGALDGAELRSKSNEAAEWFRKLVKTASELSGEEPVKSVASTDFLEWRSTPRVYICVKRPMDDVELASFSVETLSDGHKKLEFDAYLVNKGEVRATSVHSGGKVVKFEMATRGWATEEIGRTYMLMILMSDDLLRRFKESVLAFLEGYKLARITLTYLAQDEDG